MTLTTRFFLILLALAAMAAPDRFAVAASGEPLTGIYVASREFVVTVSPVDEESKNADTSDLYQRTNGEAEWTNLGVCEKIVMPHGEVRFVKVVEVENDGLYHYTSRPVVGGAVSSPPDRFSPPQASVVVDTLAPIVTLASPADNADAVAGEPLTVIWEANDENLGPRPVNLFWSADGGQTWFPLAENLSPRGSVDWTVAEELAGPALVKAEAVDLAGNRGDALRSIEVAPLEAAPAPGPAPTEPTVLGPTEPTEPQQIDKIAYDKNRSWLYYLMAVNLMRQNNPKDALQYYWLAVKADPEFIDAWADIALAYIDVGAYRTAREITVQTRELAPDRIDLMHLMGETYHAEAMDLLGRAKTAEQRADAKGLVETAVEWYGRALETAAEDWRLAEQAASYYRLGEICYYVNMDREGARAYWMKILDLHSPTPNPDLVLWTPKPERERARREYQRQIYQRVSLEAWQNWARGYVLQLDERERKGIAGLMPANRINRHSAAPAPDCGDYKPGRADGRSLFSLPTQFGSPDPVPASVGAAPNAHSAPRQPAAEYRFYALKDRPGGDNPNAAPRPRNRGNRSAFSGGPDIPAPPPADPYSFPLGNRKPAEWNSPGPYGNSPVDSW